MYLEHIVDCRWIRLCPKWLGLTENSAVNDLTGKSARFWKSPSSMVRKVDTGGPIQGESLAFFLNIVIFYKPLIYISSMNITKLTNCSFSFIHFLP